MRFNTNRIYNDYTYKAINTFINFCTYKNLK